MTRGNKLTLSPGERTVVDRERHCDCWFIDLDSRERLRLFGAGDGIAYGYAFHSSDREHIARPGNRLINSFEALKRIKLGDAGPLNGAVQFANSDFVSVP